MTLRIVSPVPLPEILDLYTLNGVARKPRQAGAAILQGARSESVGFYVGDCLLAVALLYPLDDEPGEARELVFACRPEAAAHIVGIIHMARATRARLLHDPAVTVRAYVRRGHSPGYRLARMCGLSAMGWTGASVRFELRGTDGRFRQGAVRRRR